ncbi:Bifunctional purine biosynthesis protein PurH, partial [Spiromyces aspiralis]
LIKGDTPDNLRHQLIVISALMFFQQFSGINAVIFFSTKIIDAAKHSDPHNLPTVSQIIAFSISAVAVVFTVVGMVLISFFGRRTLMLVSHGAMCIFCLCLALGSIYGIDAWVIAMVYFFNIFFNFGAGPLPWASAAEMTPKYAMSAMTSVGNAINFLFTFTIGAMFPPLADSLGDYTFLFFMGWNLLAFVFVFLYLPETKDRRVEDVIRVHSTGFHVVLGRTVPPLHAMPSKVGMASMLSNESSPGSATAADPSEQGEKNQIVLEKYTSEQSSNVAAGEDGGLEFQAPRHHPDSIKEIA